MLTACDVRTLLESGLFHDCIVRDVRVPLTARALTFNLAWVRGWDDDGVAAYGGLLG